MWSGLSFASLGGFSRCRGCDHPRPAYNGGYASVRSSLGTMLSMAKFTGCQVCAVLSDGILQFLADESCGIARDDVDQLQIDFNLAASRRSLEVALLQTPVKLSFFAAKHTPWLADYLPDLPVGNEIPQTTSSDASLAWAKQQLQICRETHKSCNSYSSAPLPSRVLDVLAPGESGVRLYVSEGETAPYIALSHCWGHKPFLRTLSGSLDAHRSEIVWARLPRTFQDVIGFARQLGIRYLWIDSLCIIQDDQHDWRREAAKMASVYQNAVLVVSAAKSEGAYGGLYAEVPAEHKVYTVRFLPGHQGDDENHNPSNTDSPDGTTPPCGPQDSSSPPEEEIHLRISLSHPHRLLSQYHAATSALPIFTRGWILQERFLSPRILHFGREEISFECLECTTCQCTHSPPSSATQPSQTQQDANNGAPAWYTQLLDRSARPKHYYALPTWQSGAMTRADLEVCWRRLVEDYTLLRLSYEKDIFPAISGMAQQMARVRPPGDGYAAGLWEGTLLAGDLLWHVELPPRRHVASASEAAGTVAAAGGGATGGVEGDQTEGAVVPGGMWEGGWKCRPDGWRAPSWSWASVAAPVGFVYGDQGILAEAEVVEVSCEPVGVDPMGEVREGGANWLVLKGRLIPALLRFKAAKKPGEEGLKPFDVVDLDMLDGGYLKNLWVDDDCRGLVAVEGEQPTVYCLIVGRKLPRKELLCLLLARVPEGEWPQARDHGPDEDEHLYRRIGLLEVFGGPATPVDWGWLHNLRDRGHDAVVRIV